MTLNANFKVKRSKKFGRHVLSINHIPHANQVVLEEAPFAFELFKSSEKSYCQLCLAKISVSREREERASFWETSIKNEDQIGCRICKTSYCSSDCQDKHKDIHSKSCRILQETSGIAGAASVDYNLLRLLCKIVLVSNEVDDLPVRKLVSHRKSASPEFKKNMLVALQDLLQFDCIASSSAYSTIEDLFALVCKINANSHAIFDSSGNTNQPIGLGLFPMTAILNHSCSPNAEFFTNAAGRTQVNTTRKLDASEQVFVSYVDIFAPRFERRGKLLETKNFWCECDRCEREEFLDAYVCQHCSGGYLIEDTNEQVFKCNYCQMTRNTADMLQANRELKLEDAHELIVAGMLEGGKKILENAIIKAQETLHPHHHIILQILVSLVNVCSRLRDFDSCFKYCNASKLQYEVLMKEANLAFSKEYEFMVDKTSEISSIVDEMQRIALSESKQV